MPSFSHINLHNFGPALVEHRVTCFTCKRNTVIVQCWPGDKPPRKICNYCKERVSGFEQTTFRLNSRAKRPGRE